MSTEQNKTTILAFFDEVWNQGDESAIARYIAENAAGNDKDFGMGRSRGTLPVQLGGNIKRGGLVELAFGATLREIIEGFGGGTRSGRPIRAVQVGGPLGAYLPAYQLDIPLDYEALASIGAMLGHGGIVVFDDTVDMAKQAKFAFDFCAKESCGKCTPCRIGSTRGVELIDRIRAKRPREAGVVEHLPQIRNARIAARSAEEEIGLLRELCDTMKFGSLCALGGFTPYPVLSALDHFPEDFGSSAPRAEAAE